MKVSWGSIRVLIIIAVASSFSWVMIREQVPQAMAHFLATFTGKLLCDPRGYGRPVVYDRAVYDRLVGGNCSDPHPGAGGR